VICIAAVAVAVAAAATAAHADTIVTFPVTSGTDTTFIVPSGPLLITAPVSAALGAAAPSGSVAATLGTVTVTDARALLASSWDATVSSTDFMTGDATAAETIANTDVNYWSGSSTATSGSATFVPGQPTSVNQVSLSTSPTAFSLTDGVGDNSVSWDPTIIVLVPASGVAGDYTGTVTHSVA